MNLGVDTKLARRILALAWPVVAAMVSQTLINQVDHILIGRLPATESVPAHGALELALILLWAIGGSLSAISVGTQALTARRYGEGQNDRAGQVMINSLTVAVLTSIAASIAGWFIAPVLFRRFSHNPDILRLGIPYLQWRILGVFPMVTAIAYKSWFDGLGKTRVHMYAAITMNVLNFALNVALIFGKWGFPALGVTGSAIASMASSYIGLLIMVGWSLLPQYLRGYSNYALGGLSMKQQWELIKLSVPSGVATVFVMCGFGLFIKIVGMLDVARGDHGPIYVAATQNTIIILMLFFTACIAYGTATATLVGQSMGQKDYELAVRYAWGAVKLGVYFTDRHRQRRVPLPREGPARLLQGRRGDRGGAADLAHLRRAPALRARGDRVHPGAVRRRQHPLRHVRGVRPALLLPGPARVPGRRGPRLGRDGGVERRLRVHHPPLWNHGVEVRGGTVAGDSNLAAHAGSTLSGHDPDDLWHWLRSFTRLRLAIPFFVVPCGYVTHRITDTPFNVPALIFISLFTIPMTALSFALLRRWRGQIPERGRSLERLVAAQTLWDVVFTTLGIHYAGGPTGLFWPFPFVPVIIGSVLLPSRSTQFLYSGVAIGGAALSAWLSGPGHVALSLLLSVMFVGFSAFASMAVTYRLAQRRSQRREFKRMRNDKELAEAVARRREEILSVVSHELASPLTTLRGYVRLMQEEMGRDRANTHLLQRVDRQVARLSALADDLLEMASSQAGAMRLKRTRFDLINALREILEAARVQFPEAEITLLGAEHVSGAWDRDRLEQLFGNLVSNAVKFGGARCRVEFKVGVDAGNGVHVQVKDDGPGISPEALSRIFEPFQRYSAERGGLGLGLAIAQAIVDLHQGRIWAESPNRQGAIFHVVLPTDAEPSGEFPPTEDLAVDRALTAEQG